MARRLTVVLALTFTASCSAPPAVTRYRVGGTVTGLEGSGLVLQLDGANDVPVRIDGEFSFDLPVPNAATYTVSVLTQPASPTQRCSVGNGTGAISGRNVIDVTVTCVTQSFAVGGMVSGLEGRGLVLRNNGGDELTITTNGPFRFLTPLKSGEAYSLAVFTQPRLPTQLCTIQNGFGVVGSGDVLGLSVVCTTRPVSIGGRVTGLVGSGLVLQNNGANDVAVQVGSTGWTVLVPRDALYTITVKTQPTTPNQTCTILNAGGTTAAIDVTNIDITCTTTLFAVGGTVTNLSGSGLVLRNSDGTDLPVAAGATSYRFQLASGAAYAITVGSQPTSPAQVCTVANASGSVAGVDVTNAHVTCVTAAFTVGGTITGLAGSGLVLQNNGASNLTRPSGSTNFTFNVASGSAYAVTVLTQPSNPTQSCAVSNSSGTVSAGNVNNVNITCTTTSFTVGGTITGLAGNGLVLVNNLAGDLPLPSGATTYSFAVPSGSAYSVTVKVQPTSATQVCTVANPGGTVANVNITNVSINCVSTPFSVGGTVSGLVGSGLVLQNNLGPDLPIATTATNWSVSALSGAAYAVTVKTQPTNPTQVCTVANPTGNVPNADVTNLAVTCTCSPYCPRVVVLAGTTSLTAGHVAASYVPSTGTWTAARIAGTTQSGTGLAILNDGSVVGLVRNNTDDLLKYTRWTGTWSALTNIAAGVTARSKPGLGGGAVAEAVFQGQDFKHYNATFSGTWGSIGTVGMPRSGPAAQVFGPSAPVVLTRGAGNLTVAYIEDTTNRPTAIDFIPTLWQNPVNVSGEVTDYLISPSIVAPSAGPAMLATWLTSTQFRFSTLTGSVWAPAANVLNATSVDSAALLALPAGEVLMLFRGLDGRLYALSYSGGAWGLPALVGPVGGLAITGSPAVAKGQGGTLAEVAYVGSVDGAAYHVRLAANRTWSAPVQVGTSVNFVSIVSGP